MRKFKFRRCPSRYNFKKTLGIILAVVGVIIIIQVVPVSLWIFLLGILLVCLGWLLFKML
ncbi:hypothetical protein [Brassicibacter mesophilus]|uniref:hypothetical protein n=1 Tax=Brassicibacter mesophilus TaxID=745119 RepID=UPI003D19806F